MKKSELRSIIRESIKNALIASYKKTKLTEAKTTNANNLIVEKFQSKTAGKIYSKLKGTDKKFFQAFSKSYDVDWANAPEEAFGKGPNPRLVNFFFVNKPKKNPFENRGWEGTIKAGLIGVTRGKEKIHVSRDRYYSSQKSTYSATGEKAKGRNTGSAMGSNAENLHNYKRFAEVADEVITIDLTKIGNTRDLKASRAAAKAGATALIDAKTTANQNRSRYEKLLTDRLANSSPGDQIVKMVDAVTKMYTQSVNKQVDMLKKKKVSSGWNDSSTKISRSYRDIMKEFEYYLRAENAAIKGADRDKASKLKAGDKDTWSEEKYYQKEMLKYARSIQKEFKELAKVLKAIDKSKDYIDLR